MFQPKNVPKDRRPKAQGQFEEEADEVLKLFEERLSQALRRAGRWPSQK